MTKITTGRQAAFHAALEGKLKLTEEEKTRWAPFLHATWNAIAPDAEEFVPRGRGRVANIVELCLDANRLQYSSNITPEEEGVLCGLWVKGDKATMKWLRQQLNY